MALILGKNVLIFSFDGFWKPWVCGKSCSLTTNAEDIETSITGAGAWRTFEYAGLTWTGSLDGLIYLQMVNTLALPDIRARQIARQKILFRYQRTDEAGNVYLDEGTALITSISDTGDNGDAATFSVQVKGSGPLTQIFTPTIVNPSGKVKRLEYTGISGETFFTSNLLNLVSVIDVVVDGQGRSRIITSGSPVNQEAKYTSSGGLGRIDVPQPINTGTECYVLYQDL